MVFILKRLSESDKWITSVFCRCRIRVSLPLSFFLPIFHSGIRNPLNIFTSKFTNDLRSFDCRIKIPKSLYTKNSKRQKLTD